MCPISFKAKPKKISRKLQHQLDREKKTRGYIELDTSRDLPIKKAMSAYVLFGNELREKIIKESDEPLKVTEIVKRIAAEWTTLTKKEKAHYKDLAKLDKARFDQELKQLTSESSESLNLPKKPLTPYMLFVKKYRQDVA